MIKGYTTIQKIEEMVTEKLYSIGITEKSYPYNPFELIEREGIILSFQKLDDVNIRGMLVRGDLRSGILINSSRSIKSQKFTAMHELFHYWFHQGKNRTICLDSDIYIANHKSIEWQANQGAACALMPSRVMEGLWEYTNGNTEYMSQYLDVSQEALENRIHTLKLKHEYYFKYFNE